MSLALDVVALKTDDTISAPKSLKIRNNDISYKSQKKEKKSNNNSNNNTNISRRYHQANGDERTSKKGAPKNKKTSGKRSLQLISNQNSKYLDSLLCKILLALFLL